MSSKNELLDARVGLLLEAMSRSDKKEIEKMIAKAMAKEKPNPAFKKEMKKTVKDEINSKEMKKMITDIVSEELAKELSSSENKQKIADVTKLVLRKLYRELAYNYTPVIDRIKI